jgi:outer membrane lipoprotein-sorting protein
MFAPLLFVIALASPQDNAAAQALLDESAAKLKPVHSVSLNVSMTMAGQTDVMNAKFMRGGYVRASSRMQGEQILTPTGGWLLMTTQKEYIKQSAEATASQRSNPLPGFEPLFDGAKPLMAGGPVEAGKLGAKATLRIPTKAAGFPGAGKQYIHLDPATKLPAGIEISVSSQTMAMSYEDVKLDPGLTSKDFEWSPPSDWKEAASSRTTGTQDYLKGLLKVGSKAPAFTLNTPTGGTTSLASTVKAAKVTLVNFWFYG